MRLSHVLTALLLSFGGIGLSQTQTYYGTSWHYDSPTLFWRGYSKLHKLTINNGNCSDQTIGIYLGAPNDSILVRELCHCPDNFLYASALDDSTRLFKINPSNAQIVSTIILNDNIGVPNALVCNAANKIHALKGYVNPRFVEIDPSNGNVTVLGASNESFTGDLVQHDSIWYSLDYYGLRRIDLGTVPMATELLFNPGNYQGGLSVFPGPCNTFLTTVWDNSLMMDVNLVNIDEHTSTFLCQTSELFFGLARVGGDYYDPDPSCPVPIDLDRDDSSGATGNDFNSATFNCNSNGVKIADEDAFIPSYPIIDTMRVSITGGLLDAGNERLSMGLPVPGIAVFNNFSTSITLTNASGNARVSDFLTTLKAILYRNLAPSPTGGTREVTVSFITRQGLPTEVALCLVNVQQLPQVTVNLGPDRVECSGSAVVLDAGNPGMTYNWNNQQTTQTINVFATGTYRVTVSDGGSCAGTDQVFVKILPSLQANLQAAPTSCASDSLLLNFQWSGGAAFDLLISTNLGFIDTLYGVTSGSTYPLPTPVATNLNAYMLTYTVSPLINFNSTACLRFSPSTRQVQVYPSPVLLINETICEGDSIYLEGAWQHFPGTYTEEYYTSTACTGTKITTLEVLPNYPPTYNYRTTCDPSLAGVITFSATGQNGCDSTIIIVTTLLASDTTILASQTCDPSLAGIFTQNLTNSAGCDSTVITTVSLVSSDLVFVASQTCDPALAGIFTQNLTNSAGCDSTVITTVSLVSSDSIFVASQTCIPALAGVFTQNLTTAAGCDSTIVTTVTLALTDTVFLTLPTCDPSQVGVFTQTLTNAAGCDSTIVTTIEPLQNDTVFVVSQTCDPSLAGIFIETLSNSTGCDSTIVTNVILRPLDFVTLTSTTCDTALVGTSMEFLVNQFGCDSVVVTTVFLLPNDTVFVTSQTCDPALAGVFTENLMNSAGCDSTIITTVTLAYIDTVHVASQTCDPALAGIFTENLVNSAGCDSTIVTTIMLLSSDTVFIASQTCDPSLAGIFTENLMNSAGCYSTIITTVTLAYIDTVHVASQTCDPSLAGIFTENLMNSAGCDSTIVTTITLLPSETVFVASQTCEPTDAGVFEEIFLNQFGCDSLVKLTVSLLPPDSCDVGLRVYAPNAFSPNGDGVNDLFQLHTNEFAQRIQSLQVYSRWGERVYEAYDLVPNAPAAGWDGMFRAQPMDAGTYLFWAIVIDLEGRVKEVKGEVVLLN